MHKLIIVFAEAKYNKFIDRTLVYCNWGLSLNYTKNQSHVCAKISRQNKLPAMVN